MGKKSDVYDHFDECDEGYKCRHSTTCKVLVGTNSTTTLRHHLNVFHKRWKDSPPPPPFSPSKKRRLLQSTLDQRSYRVLDNNALLPAIASLFARLSWPHHAIEFDEFAHLIHSARFSNIDIPSRRSVKIAQMKLAQQLRSSVVSELLTYCRSSPITIAIDGWSNTNMVKVTNVVLLCGGQAYYWCSIVNGRNHNTAAWLCTALEEVMKGIQGRGLTFAGLVADNEAVNGALFSLLEPTFPFLIRSPCAAHIIQLCVEYSFRLPAIMPLLSSMEALIHRFRNNKTAKLKLLQFQVADGVETPLAAKRPCTTRWSSHLQAAERLIEIKKYVDMVEVQPPSFWTELLHLINFLKPFQVATDTMQDDSSTLYDVYKVFRRLQLHVNRLKPGDFFYPSRDDVLHAILDMWDKHVNLNAVVICAHLSFDSNSDITFSDKINAAQDWFLEFAAQYALYWSLTEYVELDQVRRCALTEWADYLARSGSGFEKLEGNVRIMRGEQPFEPRKVWLLQRAGAPVISHAAIAVLSVAGSEAAVERTFSVQNLVHSDRRNRLSDESVEAEMFIRLNERTLKEVQKERDEGSKTKRKRKQTPLTVEMGVEDEDDEEMPSVAALFKRPVSAEEGTDQKVDENVVMAHAVDEEVKVVELPAPPLIDATDAFIEHYVRKHAITAHYKWTGPRMQVLEGEGMNWKPPMQHTVSQLRDKIKQYVRAIMAEEAEAQQHVGVSVGSNVIQCE